MKRSLFLFYGIFCYLLFFGTFCYAIGFVGGFLVPKGINDGGKGLTGNPFLINMLLLGVFGLQHSIMARQEFKAWWTKIVPVPIERSTYVLFTCIILNVMYWQWRPMTEVVWEVNHVVGGYFLNGLFFAGFGLVFYATILIDHFDLFGLRQVVNHWTGKEHKSSLFTTPTLYKMTRHPLYLGFMIAFWATPFMTRGHLLFAVVCTVYMLVAIQLEERDLIKLFGDDYRNYKKRVPMILPFPKSKSEQLVQSVK